MSSPSVNNSGAARAAADADPAASGAGTQPQMAGTFNAQKVAIVSSSAADAPDQRPSDQVDQWKQAGPKSESPANSPADLKEAAQDARGQGLLARLRTAVKAIISYFVRGLSPSAQPESLQTLLNQQRLGGLADAGRKIGAAVKNLENPKGSSTLAVINQTAKKLSLPDSAAVKAIAHPPNVRHIVQNANLPLEKHARLEENFQQAATLLDRVYEARLDMDGLTKKPSFAQILGDATKDSGIAEMKNLGQHQDRVLRNWMVHSLNLVEQCSQVMTDAAAGKDSAPYLALERIENDVQELVSKPAAKLPLGVLS